MNLADTIAAIASPPGMGAVALIRISGPGSRDAIEKIFKAAGTSQSQASLNHQKVVFGHVMDADEVVDEVLMTWFKAPHSYSGDDVAEISCHGSVYIQERIMKLLLSSGVRLAEPGEFTFRAFMNGKMDLAQAEAVADLIASTSRHQHQFALKQMRGGISDKLKELRDKLVDFASLLELELDFSQEDVAFADRSSFLALLKEIKSEVIRLMESFSTGNALKRGIPVAITGRPNAGKSTLLNAILDEEKAIVSEIPGTTRDAIEDTIIIGDIPFRFIDTAGLRDNPESIEAMGIEKTLEKIAQAEVVLYLFDIATTGIDEVKEELASLSVRLGSIIPEADLENKKFILVANKIDQLVEIPHHFRDYAEMEVVFISAKRHENLADLTDALIKTVDASALQEQLVVTNLRHYEALQESRLALEEAGSALESLLPTDLVAVDIRKALYFLGLITGEISTEELLGNIFGKFCIGK
ncbi:MAG: tRNA uridine-5-carboxymethylaminomethyl(34) synthesis GTPase MnmE [Bacteroidales bacterium]